MSEFTAADISAQMQRVLDRHGHSFHYSVLKEIENLNRAGKSNWYLIGAELPVTVKNQIMHVDFVLKHDKVPIYIIGECKRADPAKANWSFVPAPFTLKRSLHPYTYFDCIYKEANKYLRHACKASVHGLENNKPMHIGFELKTGQTGDGTGVEKSPINSAVTQALRGSSGYINQLFGFKEQHAAAIKSHSFVPAVFTTAKIWTADADISAASLTDGYLPKDTIESEQKNWLWFNHNRSRELMNSLTVRGDESAEDDLAKEFTRSVAIVGSSGIESFLAMDWMEWDYFSI